MQDKPSRRKLIWSAAFLLGGVLAYLVVDDGVTHMHVAFAEEQTALFDEMRDRAAVSEAPEVGCLEAIMEYYPSGTKQVVGSHLDRVVERARRGAVREIITTLRIRTGRDFGEDPRRWIDGLKH